MELARAWEVLGIPETSSEEEVDRRYRELALDRHPDRNGDHQDMQELNEARAVAKAQVWQRSLVPVEAVREILKANRIDVDRQNARSRAQEHTANLVQISLGRLAQLQQHTLFCAGAFVVFGVMLKFVPFVKEPDLISTLMSWFLLSISAILGLYAMALQGQAKRVKLSIQHLAEGLADTSTYAEVLEGITRFIPVQADSMGYTREELEDASEVWLGIQHGQEWPRALRLRPASSFADLARIAGRRDFISLVIARGIENGLLQEHRRREKGRIRVEFHPEL